MRHIPVLLFHGHISVQNCSMLSTALLFLLPEKVQINPTCFFCSPLSALNFLKRQISVLDLCFVPLSSCLSPFFLSSLLSRLRSLKLLFTSVSSHKLLFSSLSFPFHTCLLLSLFFPGKSSWFPHTSFPLLSISACYVVYDFHQFREQKMGEKKKKMEKKKVKNEVTRETPKKQPSTLLTHRFAMT